MTKLLLWLLLLFLCWPLALLAIILYPFVWLLMLPFRLLGITVDAVFDLIKAIITLPAGFSERYKRIGDYRVKMLKVIPLLLITAVCLMPQKNPLNKIFSQLPDHLSLWEKPSTFEIYGPENLFDYINGGAELYLSYGFKQLLSCTYTGQDQPDITIDLFDMGNSHQAFGVFSHSREAIDDSIGQGCEYGGGLLIFWKGQFYISILAYPETEVARQAILHIGREIAGTIGEKGQLPSILKLLPAEDLVRESIRYFNHYIWLNSHYFISNDNILHIDRHTEAVLAQYKKGFGKYFMLLVEYPELEKAQKAYSDFRKYYLKGSTSGIENIQDNRWAGCQLRSKRLWLVFNAGSKKEIDDIFARLLVE